MKKLFTLILIATLSVLAAFAAGCADNKIDFDTENSVRVEFVLEGGTYMNSTANIVYYYKFPEGAARKIKDPAALNEKDRLGRFAVVRPGYYLEGWYKNKDEENGDVTYNGKWDFKDPVDKGGMILFANWVPVIKYSYEIWRPLNFIEEEDDDEAEDSDDVRFVSIIEYKVNEGDVFVDKRNKAVSEGTKEGFTFVGFYDEDGNEWDDEFTHPGGKTDTVINVYAKYTRGVYENVANKQQLVSAINRIQRGEKIDIRLTADIDMAEGLEPGELGELEGFDSFSRIFDGNNHTIKNFKLVYTNDRKALSKDNIYDNENTLPISLFGVCNDAIVKDVTFENMLIVVNNGDSTMRGVAIAPLTVKAIESSFTNITVKATYTVTLLSNNCSADDVVAITDRGYYYKDDKSIFENITLDIDDQTYLYSR